MDTTKIIKGVVNSGRYTVTAPIIKEDYGLYLQIEGVELPQTYEVDFSNSEHNGTSVTMIGNSDGVLIPHQFIDTGKDVFAFLYHVGEDFGRTVYKFRIPNKCRPDRTDDTPTPEEQSTIDQAISALNTAVAQTAEDRENADASAQSAYESADEAQQARDNAQTYANNAQASATSASQSATASANSASASAQSASEAQSASTNAETYALNSGNKAVESAQSATASATSATQAQGYANDASASAQSASGYASSAQTSAQTASSKAQDASQSASTASTKATEASQSATNAQGYAQTAEQAKTASQTAQGLAESARDLAQGYAEDAQGYANDAQASAEGISASASQIAQNTADIASLEEDRYKPYVTDSASGSVASFPDGADGIPLKSLVVDINPVQDLSNGDPSPENICPISGWTGMQLTQANENLIPESLPDNVIKGNPSGGKIVGATNARLFAIPIPKGTTLHVQKKSNDISGEVICLLDDGTPQVGEPYYSLKGFTNAYDHTYSAQERTWMGIRGETLAITEELFTTRELMVSVGNARKEYVAPKGYSTRYISWQSEAGTVYGGKLDVLSGVMRVEMADVDLGTLTWTYQSSYHRFNSSGIASRVKIPSSSNVNIGGLCSAYVVRSVSQVILNDNGLGVSTSGTIGIIDTRFTDPTEFKTAVEGVHYIYPLATPIEIQLTPHEVNSLLGQNNIFADTGGVSVEYRADTKLYIERLTAPDSADMVADANITSGQYFMVGNSLYKATANIASGGQVIVGTNCIRKSLSEALNEINA